MDIEAALSHIEFLKNKYEDELLFQRWIHDIHLHMSFSEFKESLIPKPKKSETQILDDVKDIIDMMKGVN